MFVSQYVPLNKKEWMTEYKRICSTFKQEEKQLIGSYLAEDFHLHKIFNVNKEEVDNENKILQESMKSLKMSINDIYSYYKGHQQFKNQDIKFKFYKIEESINKHRIDYKNRFEALLIEEEQLEKEITEFQESFDHAETNQEGNKQDGTTYYGSSQENVPNNNYINNANAKTDKLDAYIEYIMNAINIAFNQFPEEEVIKIVEKIDDIDLIRNKALIIDYVIDKKLGGVNLSWQAREHQDFLKVYTASNGKIDSYEFMSDLENALPFLPRSELKNHIKSYNKYIQLFELKKMLINRYKSIKSNKDKQEKEHVLENLEKNRMVNEQKKNMTNEIYSKEQKQKLEEWKQKKQQAKFEKYEENLKIEQEKQEKERQKYIERTKRVQPLLEEYKRRKSFVKQSEKSQFYEKPEINEIDLERIKEKSNQLIERKKSMITSKSVSKIKTAESYMKYKLKKMEQFDKIEPKLQEKTENCVNKQRKKHDYKSNKNADSMAGNVLGHMTRAIPEWRKSLY